MKYFLFLFSLILSSQTFCQQTIKIFPSYDVAFKDDNWVIDYEDFEDASYFPYYWYHKINDYYLRFNYRFQARVPKDASENNLVEIPEKVKILKTTPNGFRIYNSADEGFYDDENDEEDAENLEEEDSSESPEEIFLRRNDSIYDIVFPKIEWVIFGTQKIIGDFKYLIQFECAPKDSAAGLQAFYEVLSNTNILDPYQMKTEDFTYQYYITHYFNRQKENLNKRVDALEKITGSTYSDFYVEQEVRRLIFQEANDLLEYLNYPTETKIISKKQEDTVDFDKDAYLLVNGTSFSEEALDGILTKQAIKLLEVERLRNNALKKSSSNIWENRYYGNEYELFEYLGKNGLYFDSIDRSAFADYFREFSTSVSDSLQKRLQTVIEDTLKWTVSLAEDENEEVGEYYQDYAATEDYDYTMDIVSEVVDSAATAIEDIEKKIGTISQVFTNYSTLKPAQILNFFKYEKAAAKTEITLEDYLNYFSQNTRLPNAIDSLKINTMMSNSDVMPQNFYERFAQNIYRDSLLIDNIKQISPKQSDLDLINREKGRHINEFWFLIHHDDTIDAEELYSIVEFNYESGKWIPKVSFVRTPEYDVTFYLYMKEEPTEQTLVLRPYNDVDSISPYYITNKKTHTTGWTSLNIPIVTEGHEKVLCSINYSYEGCGLDMTGNFYSERNIEFLPGYNNTISKLEELLEKEWEKNDSIDYSYETYFKLKSFENFLDFTNRRSYSRYATDEVKTKAYFIEKFLADKIRYEQQLSKGTYFQTNLILEDLNNDGFPEAFYFAYKDNDILFAKGLTYKNQQYVPYTDTNFLVQVKNSLAANAFEKFVEEFELDMLRYGGYDDY